MNLVSVSVIVKNVGLDDSEKQEIKTDERRLMADERRAMATCDGGEGADAKLLEMSPASMLSSYSTFGKMISIDLGLLAQFLDNCCC